MSVRPKPVNGDFLVKTVGNYEIIMECYTHRNDPYIRFKINHIGSNYMFSKSHKTVEEAEKVIRKVIKLDPPIPVIHLRDGLKGLATGFNMIQFIHYFEIDYIDPMPESSGYLSHNARYGDWVIMTPETEAKSAMIKALEAQRSLIYKQIQEIRGTMEPVSEESFTAYALEGKANVEEALQ